MSYIINKIHTKENYLPVWLVHFRIPLSSRKTLISKVILCNEVFERLDTPGKLNLRDRTKHTTVLIRKCSQLPESLVQQLKTF